MREREHYYYVYDDVIVKAFNRKQASQAGYDIKHLRLRCRHFYDAASYLRQRHIRPKYVSLTGNDFID